MAIIYESTQVQTCKNPAKSPADLLHYEFLNPVSVIPDFMLYWIQFPDKLKIGRAKSSNCPKCREKCGHVFCIIA
ncbi:MAG: hypothetical protein LUH18_08230 [Oscillospiraceae bacterium]|nr:hypothetical protein [Oscillospiraceae bacterium]